MRGLWWKLLVGVWMSSGILAAFLLVGPAPGFTMGGEGAKVFFFHMPNAWITCLAYVVAAWYAAKYLRNLREQGEPGDDLKSAAAMELGLLFSILATVTGSVFAHNEWHSYWNWDPRETTIVIIMLIFAAYLALRGAVIDPAARARLSAAYALVAVVPGLFLIWVVPRLVTTLHPNQAVVGGELAGGYRSVLYGLIMPAFIGLFVWMFQLRVRSQKLLERPAV